MSLTQIVFSIVTFVWAVGCVITAWTAKTTTNGTSGGIGIVVITWIAMVAVLVAAILGWLLTLFIGNVGYLIALFGLIIFVVWFIKR